MRPSGSGTRHRPRTRLHKFARGVGGAGGKRGYPPPGCARGWGVNFTRCRVPVMSPGRWGGREPRGVPPPLGRAWPRQGLHVSTAEMKGLAQGCVKAAGETGPISKLLQLDARLAQVWWVPPDPGCPPRPQHLGPGPLLTDSEKREASPGPSPATASLHGLGQVTLPC